MNCFSSFGNRIFQKGLYLACFFLPFKEPICRNSLSDIAEIIEVTKHKKPFIVMGKTTLSLGLADPLFRALEEHQIPYEVFSDVKPDPTFEIIDNGYAKYVESGCDCIVAFGGGSSMDAAKAIAARVSKPGKDNAYFKGLLKVGKNLPLLIAVPTTAGTGSEATVAAVVTNEKTNDKFAISDPKLIPSYAILDDSLLAGLPNKVIAATGMDALTHAVEAFIGHSGTKKTDAAALESISLIKDNLKLFYDDHSNPAARGNMLKASYLAGVAFTRAYVGYVHALAHSLGGYCHFPHGYACAVLLPHVLRAYGKKAHKKLAIISDRLSLVTTDRSKKEKADAVISWIESLNASMDIPNKFPPIDMDIDLSVLALHAAKEGNPFYPVPKEMDKKELLAILKESINEN